MMKIAVVGTGYVGLSNAVLLSQHNEVVALAPLQGALCRLYRSCRGLVVLPGQDHDHWG